MDRLCAFTAFLESELSPHFNDLPEYLHGEVFYVFVGVELGGIDSSIMTDKRDTGRAFLDFLYVIVAYYLNELS